MATLTSPDVSAGVQPKGSRVGVYSTAAIFSVAASMSSGDVIQMIKVPSGATVVDIKTTVKLAGKGSVSVGDGVSANRYTVDTAASDSAGTMIINNPVFTPYAYSTDDTIDVTTSASTNFSAGSVCMIVTLSMDA